MLEKRFIFFPKILSRILIIFRAGFSWFPVSNDDQ